jgi:hypothetical protein
MTLESADVRTAAMDPAARASEFGAATMVSGAMSVVLIRFAGGDGRRR